MNNLMTLFNQVNFLTLLWIFFFIFVLHEFEEWNIDRFERKHFVGLPPAATDRSARMWIFCVCLIGLTWILAATLPGQPALAAWIFLPAVAILIQNSLQHVYWTFFFKQTAPGVFTAAFLLIPYGSFLILRALHLGYVPLWYAAILLLFIAAGSIQTILAGSKMPPLIRGINEIGIWLAERIR